ncbi:hypothetical protein [Evansella clarkii]|uniref:hypothetical protein n=1 Tax=Evansella clarkii TaxID=79879 RepID=UPI0014309742|nr:hypothetical protein [Evansella clarkii]
MDKKTGKEFFHEERIESTEKFTQESRHGDTELETSIQETYEQLSPEDTEGKNH